MRWPGRSTELASLFKRGFHRRSSASQPAPVALRHSIAGFETGTRVWEGVPLSANQPPRQVVFAIDAVGRHTRTEGCLRCT